MSIPNPWSGGPAPSSWHQQVQSGRLLINVTTSRREQAQAILRQAGALEIADKLTHELEADGGRSFADSYHRLNTALESKIEERGSNPITAASRDSFPASDPSAGWMG